MIGGLALVAHAGNLLEGFSAELLFVDTRDRNFIEIGGEETDMAFKRYKMTSERLLLSPGYTFMDKITASIQIGTANLRTHASEGETWKFSNTSAYGATVRGLIYGIPSTDLTVWGSARFLSFSSSESKMTRASRRGPDRGALSMSWSEIEAGLEIMKQMRDTEIVLGIRYMTISAKQERVLEGVAYDSTFDQEDSFGFYAGGRAFLTDQISLYGQVNFFDETTFRSGIRYDF